MAAGDTGFFLLWGFVLVLMVVGFGFEGVRKLRQRQTAERIN